MTAHLMDKGLNICLDPDFENRLPVKEIGPFDLTTDDGKKFKEAVDLIKKCRHRFECIILQSVLLAVLQSDDQHFNIHVFNTCKAVW